MPSKGKYGIGLQIREELWEYDPAGKSKRAVTCSRPVKSRPSRVYEIHAHTHTHICRYLYICRCIYIYTHAHSYFNKQIDT